MPNLHPTAEKFILHWGEMGTRWGVNRTVAQIHALLYLSDKPLHAEEIAETLSIARSNVSTSLKELQNWGLIRVVHVLGDRRDHFDTLGDVWELLRQVLEERKRREMDPTLEVLRECMTELKKGGPETAHLRTRVKGMLDFFETFAGLYDQFRTRSTSSLVKVAKMGGKLSRLIGL